VAISFTSTITCCTLCTKELSSYLDGRPFGHNRHWSKSGELLCPFPRGQLGPHLTQCRLGRGLPPYMKWRLDPSGRLATMDMGQKLGIVPLLRELDSPSNTMWPASKPIWHLDIGRTVLANVDVRYICCRLSRLSVVYRLSVTLVRRTQAVEIFGNISTAFGTLATR